MNQFFSRDPIHQTVHSLRWAVLFGSFSVFVWTKAFLETVLRLQGLEEGSCVDEAFEQLVKLGVLLLNSSGSEFTSDIFSVPSQKSETSQASQTSPSGSRTDSSTHELQSFSLQTSNLTRPSINCHNCEHESAGSS